MKKIIIIFLLFFTSNVFAAEEEPVLTGKLERLTKNYIINVAGQVNQLKENIAEDFGDDFVNYCVIIVALGGIFYVGVRLVKTLQKGEIVDLNTLLLPFIFIFVISFYRPFTQFVDYTTGGFQYFIASKSNNIDMELTGLRNEKINLARKINARIYEREVEIANGRWFVEIIAYARKIFRDVKKWFSLDYLVAGFFLLLLYVSSFLIRITGAILTISLYIIGPFTIALSVIPIFKDAWKTWLTTYIWGQLFSPVCQICSYILANLEKMSLEIDVSRLQQIYENYGAELAQPISESFYSGLTYIAFMAAGTVMFWAVPTVASWIVPAQGGGTLSALNAFASKTFAGALSRGAAVKNIFTRRNGIS